MNSLSEATEVTQNGFRFSLRTDPPGVSEVPGMEDLRVSIHAGPPVQVASRRAGYHHSGISVYGDIHVIPAGTPSRWEVSGKDTFLTLSVSSELLKRAAEEMDLDPDSIEIRDRCQVRDAQLENIGWVLKEEMECGCPCGPLYIDSLAMAVAMRLICCHSSRPVKFGRPNKRLSDRRLRRVLIYIEDNLAGDISLSDLAAVIGISVSHFKILFREAVGLSAHQYVIRRRLERAKKLLAEGELSIGQIAIETGFANQSHLGRHMHRMMGVSPRVLRSMLR